MREREAFERDNEVVEVILSGRCGENRSLSYYTAPLTKYERPLNMLWNPTTRIDIDR
jgi:hypothetical protein